MVDFRLYAFARLMLRGWIDHLQTSWVKLGPELSQLTLLAGCDDFGGTLMEESISKSAGADFGEYLPEEKICELIAGVGRIPVQRTTTYGRISSSDPLRSDRGTGRGSRGSTVSAGAVLAS
jgi:2-iminoacetate synthase ThiH